MTCCETILCQTLKYQKQYLAYFESVKLHYLVHMYLKLINVQSDPMGTKNPIKLNY